MFDGRLAWQARPAMAGAAKRSAEVDGIVAHGQGDRTMECAKGQANTPYGHVLGSSGGGRLRFVSKDRTVETQVLDDGSYVPPKWLGPTCWAVSYRPEDGKYGPVSPPCVDIPKTSGFYRQDFTRVDAGRVPVWGTVTDAAGRSVTACQEVEFGGSSLVTGPDGSFATALAPGEYTVKVNGAPVEKLTVNGEPATLTVPEPTPMALGIAAGKVRAPTEDDG
jgi:uncharacterized Zn-binding protein involved in type VI secretion